MADTAIKYAPASGRDRACAAAACQTNNYSHSSLQIHPVRRTSRATRRAIRCDAARASSSSVAVVAAIRLLSSSGIRTARRFAWPTGTGHGVAACLAFFIFICVSLFFSFRTAGRLSENIYSFTAEAGDNKARFRCEASNVMSQTPLKAEVDLAVLCKCNKHTHTHTHT